jgi:hypothetical protein
MINFRKMRLGDLDSIYQDKELRPIITVQPKGHKFAVVLEEDGQILGGASGYAEDNAAFLQCTVIKDSEHKGLYKDGLIRSLIHFLELDGAEFLFVKEDDPLFRKIGFCEIRVEDEAIQQLGDMILEDVRQEPAILYINLKEFFRNKNC